MTPDLEVRKASESDVRLVQEASKTLHPNGSQFDLLEEILHPISQLWIALRGQSCVGYCLLRSVLGEVEILHIEVLQTSRKQGVGKALLRYALNGCDGDIVFLEVREGNSPAIHLYETNGFTVVGRRENYYKEPTEDAVLMKKPLRGG